jgi:hypothetical protein
MIFTNICHLFATLEYFFAVKIFRLRNYSYICSEMGISSEEIPFFIKHLKWISI